MGKVEADGAVVVTGNACNVQYWCGHGGCLFGYDLEPKKISRQ